jgi:glucose-6-phosphate isomerase
VSTERAKVTEFGIDRRNMFGFWDWVGGRYSMDSAIGLSTMLADRPGALSRDARRLSRDGRAFPDRALRPQPARAHGLDRHLEQDFLGAETVPCCRTSRYLKRFPAYLQQLTMESNGKRVTVDGDSRRVQHRTDLLGRAGHQRPAFVLPVDPSGHAPDPLRFHRLRRSPSTRCLRITISCSPTFSRKRKPWPSARPR